MIWSIADLADAASSALEEEAARLDHEQAVHGIDTFDELGLHPLLGAGFARAGYGIERERRYPSGRAARRESEGDRCDAVLAPPGRSVAATESRATLFECESAAPDEALFWMEIKVAAQFTEGGQNGAWSRDLVTLPRRDLRKLAGEPSIHHRGLLLVLFAASAAVIDHDLAVALDRFTESGAPIGFPSVRSFALRDRIGHGVAAVALLPVGTLDPARRRTPGGGPGGGAAGLTAPSTAAHNLTGEPTFEPLPGAELTGEDFWGEA